MPHTHPQLRRQRVELAPFAAARQISDVAFAISVIHLRALSELRCLGQRQKALHRQLPFGGVGALVGEHEEAGERVRVEVDLKLRGDRSEGKE